MATTNSNTNHHHQQPQRQSGTKMIRVESASSTPSSSLRPFTGSEMTHITVITYLGLSSLSSIARVNHGWHRLVTHHRLVLQHMYTLRDRLECHMYERMALVSVPNQYEDACTDANDMHDRQYDGDDDDVPSDDEPFTTTDGRLDYLAKTRWTVTRGAAHRDYMIAIGQATQLQRWYDEYSYDRDDGSSSVLGMGSYFDESALNSICGFETRLLGHLRLPARGDGGVWNHAEQRRVTPPIAAVTRGSRWLVQHQQRWPHLPLPLVAAIPVRPYPLTLYEQHQQSEEYDDGRPFPPVMTTPVAALSQESWSSRAARLLPLLCNPSSLTDPWIYPSLVADPITVPTIDPSASTSTSPPSSSSSTAADSSPSSLSSEQRDGLLASRPLLDQAYLHHEDTLQFDAGPLSITQAAAQAHIDLNLQLLTTPSPSPPRPSSSSSSSLHSDVQSPPPPPPSYITPIMGLRSHLPMSDMSALWLAPSQRIPNQPISSSQVALKQLMIDVTTPFIVAAPSSSSSSSSKSSRTAGSEPAATPNSSSSSSSGSLEAFINAVLPPTWPLPESLCRPSSSSSSVAAASCCGTNTASRSTNEWYDRYGGAAMGTFGHGIFHPIHEYAIPNDNPDNRYRPQPVGLPLTNHALLHKFVDGQPLLDLARTEVALAWQSLHALATTTPMKESKPTTTKTTTAGDSKEEDTATRSGATEDDDSDSDISDEDDDEIAARQFIHQTAYDREQDHADNIRLQAPPALSQQRLRGSERHAARNINRAHALQSMHLIGSVPSEVAVARFQAERFYAKHDDDHLLALVHDELETSNDHRFAAYRWLIVVPKPFRAAARHLLRAIALFPTHGLRLAMSQLYAIVGLRDQAHQFFTFAVDLPSHMPLVDFDFHVQVYKDDLMSLLNDAKQTNDYTNVLHNAIHALLRRAGVVSCAPATCALLLRYMQQYIKCMLSTTMVNTGVSDVTRVHEWTAADIIKSYCQGGPLRTVMQNMYTSCDPFDQSDTDSENDEEDERPRTSREGDETKQQQQQRMVAKARNRWLGDEQWLPPSVRRRYCTRVSTTTTTTTTTDGVDEDDDTDGSDDDGGDDGEDKKPAVIAAAATPMTTPPESIIVATGDKHLHFATTSSVDLFTALFPHRPFPAVTPPSSCSSSSSSSSSATSTTITTIPTSTATAASAAAVATVTLLGGTLSGVLSHSGAWNDNQRDLKWEPGLSDDIVYEYHQHKEQRNNNNNNNKKEKKDNGHGNDNDAVTELKHMNLHALTNGARFCSLVTTSEPLDRDSTDRLYWEKHHAPTDLYLDIDDSGRGNHIATDVIQNDERDARLAGGREHDLGSDDVEANEWFKGRHNNNGRDRAADRNHYARDVEEMMKGHDPKWSEQSENERDGDYEQPLEAVMQLLDPDIVVADPVKSVSGAIVRNIHAQRYNGDIELFDQFDPHADDDREPATKRTSSPSSSSTTTTTSVAQRAVDDEATMLQTFTQIASSTSSSSTTSRNNCALAATTVVVAAAASAPSTTTPLPADTEEEAEAEAEVHYDEHGNRLDTQQVLAIARRLAYGIGAKKRRIDVMLRTMNRHDCNARTDRIVAMDRTLELAERDHHDDSKSTSSDTQVMDESKDGDHDENESSAPQKKKKARTAALSLPLSSTPNAATVNASNDDTDDDDDDLYMDDDMKLGRAAAAAGPPRYKGAIFFADPGFMDGARRYRWSHTVGTFATADLASSESVVATARATVLSGGYKERVCKTLRYDPHDSGIPIAEIKYFQRSDKPIIPRAAMQHLIHQSLCELVSSSSPSSSSPSQPSQQPAQLSLRALAALQHGLETEITSLLENALLMHIHAYRVTLLPMDVIAALRVRHGDTTWHNPLDSSVGPTRGNI